MGITHSLALSPIPERSQASYKAADSAKEHTESCSQR
jgi:hypothetical protein